MNSPLRRFRRTLAFTLVPALLLLLPNPSAADTPTQQLRAGIDRVLATLRDPALAGEARTAQRHAAIVRIAHDIFDFSEMARRSLGQHWDRRTPAERTEFVRLFTDLIQRSYVSKVDQHPAVSLAITGERVEADRAIVQTVLPLDHGRQLPLDYRMHRADDRWRVYDISIDGISLVANYRAQFNRIIRTTSYDALVAKLRSNAAEFSGAAAASPGAHAGR
jgi:phospholipid transport system substrate-binding protein